MQQLPFISIIFPTRNNAGDTLATLKSLGRLDYPRERLEILIWDNASTDGTPARIRQALAAMVVGNALGLAQVRWLLKLSPYDRKWAKPLVAGLAGGLLVAGLQRVAPVAPPVWNLALSTGAFSLCYVGLLLLQQLEREDLQMLRLLRAKVFRSQGAG